MPGEHCGSRDLQSTARHAEQSDAELAGDHFGGDQQNHDVPIPITSPVTMFGATPGMITFRSMAEWVLPGFKALQVEEDRLRLAVKQIVNHGQPSFQVFFCRGPNRYPYRRLRVRNRERCTPRNCHPLLTRM